MNHRRWGAILLSVACLLLGAPVAAKAGASTSRPDGAHGADGDKATAAPARAIPIPDPPKPPPLAGLPGTGRVIGIPAADLANAAPIPVLVALSPEAAARPELRDRKAGRPAWTPARRDAAKADVAAQQDTILRRIAASIPGVPSTVDTTVIAGAMPGQAVTVERRLTYTYSAVRLTVPGNLLTRLAHQAGVIAVYDDRPTPRLKLDHSVPYVQAPQVWSGPSSGTPFFGNKGKDELIAVIDTGIDWDHPMFGGNGLGQPGTPNPAGPGSNCYGRPPGPNCDTYNKKVVYAQAAATASPNGSPKDDNGHGTHVASTAAGIEVTAPIGKISGVAPDALLMAYKVLSSAGAGSSSDIELAMEDAVQNTPDHRQADVVNMSLGSVTPTNDPFDPEAIIADIGTLLGTVFALANGNSGPGRATIST